MRPFEQIDTFQQGLSAVFPTENWGTNWTAIFILVNSLQLKRTDVSFLLFWMLCSRKHGGRRNSLTHYIHMSPKHHLKLIFRCCLPPWKGHFPSMDSLSCPVKGGKRGVIGYEEVSEKFNIFRRTLYWETLSRCSLCTWGQYLKEKTLNTCFSGESFFPQSN